MGATPPKLLPKRRHLRGLCPGTRWCSWSTKVGRLAILARHPNVVAHGYCTRGRLGYTPAMWMPMGHTRPWVQMCPYGEPGFPWVSDYRPSEIDPLWTHTCHGIRLAIVVFFLEVSALPWDTYQNWSPVAVRHRDVTAHGCRMPFPVSHCPRHAVFFGSWHSKDNRG